MLKAHPTVFWAPTRDAPTVLSGYRFEFAVLVTLTALDALILLKDVHLFFVASYRIYRADLFTSSATDANVEYLVMQKILANTRTTKLTIDMLFIFLAEMA